MEKKKKLKLRPSARDNRRYLLIDCKENEKVEGAILDYIGILGIAKSAYFFVKTEGDKVIGSCLRESLNPVLASLAFAEIKVLKVSGTLKGLKK
jgi:RNase P/RNase MRP subunit POP5